MINHYAVPPQYYPLARQNYFAKNLMKKGHTVTIFAASTVHNSEQNLITDGQLWRDEVVDGVHYVYIKCKDYHGNGLKRIYNMCEFAWKLPRVCKKFSKPDAIVATSMPPMSCAKGIKLSKKYRCKGVAEIADLWPESLISYGIAGPKNPAVLFLRKLEKWIYKKADAIVFTMEGAYDYIIEQGWEKEIPREKVSYINNGVDLELFNYNLQNYQIQDEDLEDSRTYKIVYMGSLRKANDQIYRVVDVASAMKNDEKYRDARILVYGKGELMEELQERCKNFPNIILKGFVEKRYVPYVLSKCNLNILNCKGYEVLRYGGSQNKLFDYLASGKPIISGENSSYSIVNQYKCGIARKFETAEEILKAIDEVRMGEFTKEHIQAVAEQYDYKVLTDKLLAVIEGEVNK